MATRTPVPCDTCEEVCGYDYPDSGPTYESGGEPAYREGIGENFEFDGIWHCSEKCKQEAIESQAGGE